MSTDKSVPLVSIIVPVYNGQSFLEKFFGIFQQNLLVDHYELILVDNGSTDGTWEALTQLEGQIPQLRVFQYTEKQSSYAARNYGVAQSVGVLLAFTDFDCWLQQDYIDYLAYFTAENIPNGLISGSVEIYYESKNIYEIFDKSAYLRQDIYILGNYAATANLVVSRQAFQSIGGFDELVSGGDNNFCQRAHAMNFKIVFKPQLQVLHPPRKTLHDHLVKAERLGIGHGQVFSLKNSSSVEIGWFILKQSINLVIPRHQIDLFLKIKKRETLTLSQTFSLAILCYRVGVIQRFETLKSYLKICRSSGI